MDLPLSTDAHKVQGTPLKLLTEIRRFPLDNRHRYAEQHCHFDGHARRETSIASSRTGTSPPLNVRSYLIVSFAFHLRLFQLSLEILPVHLRQQTLVRIQEVSVVVLSVRVTVQVRFRGELRSLNGALVMARTEEERRACASGWVTHVLE